jgi:hypothetical protein
LLDTANTSRAATEFFLRGFEVPVKPHLTLIEFLTRNLLEYFLREVATAKRTRDLALLTEAVERFDLLLRDAAKAALAR